MPLWVYKQHFERFWSSTRWRTWLLLELVLEPVARDTGVASAQRGHTTPGQLCTRSESPSRASQLSPWWKQSPSKGPENLCHETQAF